MSEEKTYPTHRISFSEKIIDQDGKDKVGKPVEVAAVWPRKDGKQGGIIQWNISPEKLGDGVYFHLENERQQNRGASKPDRFDQVDAKVNEPQKEQGVGR